MDIEAEYRRLIPWVAEHTRLRMPIHLSGPGAWTWDDINEDLTAMTDDGQWRFHVEMTVGRRRIYHAVVSVEDDDGITEWEAEIPPDVVAAAKAE